MSEFRGDTDPAQLNSVEKAALIQGRIAEAASSWQPQGAFLCSNDERYSEVLGSATAAIPAVAEGQTSAALLVGNSFAFSLLPHLRDIDIVVMVDDNRFMHQWFEVSAQTLLETPKGPDEAERYIQALNLKHRGIYGTLGLPEEYLLNSKLRKEFESIGQYSYLRPENFARSRAALRERYPTIVRAALDLADDEAVGDLGTALEHTNTSITFANLTNIYEHMARPHLLRTLPQLPFHGACSVTYSSLITYDEYPGDARFVSAPIAKHRQGLRGYLEGASRDSNTFQQFIKNARFDDWWG